MQVYVNTWVTRSSDSFYQKAIEIVQKAIDHDSKQNYAEAYKYYQNSLDYFMLALKCRYLLPLFCLFIQSQISIQDERSGKSKELLIAKTQEYLQRAEALKRHLTSEEKGKNAIGVNGGGGATGLTGKQ